MSENNVENTSTSGENLENNRLRSWLEEKLDSGQFPCLSWIDKDRGKFQIDWQEDRGDSAEHNSLDQLCKKWAEECGPGNDAKVNPPSTERPRQPDQPDEGKNDIAGLRQAVTASRDILETAKNTRTDCCTYMFAHQPAVLAFPPQRAASRAYIYRRYQDVSWPEDYSGSCAVVIPERRRPEDHGVFDVGVSGAGEPEENLTSATVAEAPPVLGFPPAPPPPEPHI